MLLLRPRRLGAVAAATTACSRAARPAAAAAAAALGRRPFSQAATAAAANARPSPAAHTLAAPRPERSRPYSSSSSSTAPAAKPDYLDEAEAEIWERLAAEFAPAALEVRDVSGGCGSMYSIEISSERFRGLGLLKQQRLVNAALGDLMKGWHGLQLRTRVP